MTAKAFIGLGSNLGDREAYLRGALAGLAQQSGKILAYSGLYETEPVGYRHQPRFLNAVVCIETDLPPEDLLDVLLEIERTFGRERAIRWGPRTLDLDLLLYGERTVRTERLTVPHPRMFERSFVLMPLLELKQWLPQTTAQRVEQVVTGCDLGGVVAYKERGWAGNVY